MKMLSNSRRDFLKMMGAGAAALTLPGWGSTFAAAAPSRPNILYILCDDLGIGDVHALNPERGKIATPNIDKLVGQGITFTDAHSASAVCTPTRYGIMTGRYPWRSRMKGGVGNGFSPRLIEDGRMTVASLLKEHGYATAAIGKWHLGMDWPLKEAGVAQNYEDQWKVDYTKPIQNGPNAVGFDYYFGISASLDMPPYVFIENDKVMQAPTVEKAWPVGPLRTGPTAAEFKAVNVIPTLEQKAVETVGRLAEGAKGGKPFFIYLPLSAPHTPVIPTEDLRGKSEIGWYGDFVVEVDRTIGKVLDALEKSGQAGQTLVFFASDNGFAPYVGYIQSERDTTGGREKVKEIEARGHFPSAAWRGYKTDSWEGGHHIPFAARWPGRIQSGSRYEQTVCLNDLMATCAEILGTKLPDNAGEDSVSLLPALLGKTKEPVREATVHASGNGQLAIRQGEWKLIFSRVGQAKQGAKTPFELYNMSKDPAEQVNECAAHPEVVARLKALMTKYVREGRSTPGAPQKNTDPQSWPQLWWMDGYTGPAPADGAGSGKKKNGPGKGKGKKKKAAGAA